MKVIKLGGSLINDEPALHQCLNSIERNHSDKVIIVPGGGVFADQVRLMQQQWKFDDKTAHQMAILAMQQMALLLNSIKRTFIVTHTISAINQALLDCSVVIWSPDIKELDFSGIRACWDVTSDSLAAWLAGQLSATELIIVKSAEIPLQANIQQMQEAGLLDKAFNEFTQSSSYKISIINKNKFNEYFLI
jgi:aspartokinase-like uncharacterized kinase